MTRTLLVVLLLVLPAPSFALCHRSPPTWGQYWTRMQDYERTAYLQAYWAGAFDAYLLLNATGGTSSVLPYAEYDEFRTSRMLTWLYSDPANNYVNYSTMIRIAKARVQSTLNDVEVAEWLRVARQRAMICEEVLQPPRPLVLPATPPAPSLPKPGSGTLLAEGK